MQLMGYPADLTLANIARLLLCVTMVLTFPLPFLTCREMSILICVDLHAYYYKNNLDRFNIFAPLFETTTAILSSIWAHIISKEKKTQQTPTLELDDAANNAKEDVDVVQMQRPSFFSRWKRLDFGADNIGNNEEWGPITEALLAEGEQEKTIIHSIGGQQGKEINPSPLSSRSGSFGSSETTISSVVVPTPSWLLKDDDGRQLTLLWHSALTFSLWFIVTICAIKSPSLGDVLDLVGAFTGTVMAFILPALFSFRLKGYSNISLAILVIGGVVGLLGTCFSIVKFSRDVE